jgi:hypothetical protein
MGTCLVKCLQPLATHPAEVYVPALLTASLTQPAFSQVGAQSSATPLLRPPIV